MGDSKVKVAIIGLGFGSEFGPIYNSHPNAELYALCRRNEVELHKCADQLGVKKRYTSYDDVLADPAVDMVHINSPIGDHGWMSIAALKAGKHVMCTVPMATTIEECEEICNLVTSTGLKYMMAETTVYSREFLYIKEMVNRGDFGHIQFLEASHPQDMDGWPEYWQRMVPMHYATHVVAPCLGLLDGLAEHVSCFGSGSIRDSLQKSSGYSASIQSCHIKFLNSDLVARVSRFLFDTARQYRESFDVYGTKKSFEWALVEGEEHIIHTAKMPEPEIPSKITIPDFADRLPQEIRKFTQTIEDADHLSFIQGGGHGGSHPHIIHEMITSLIDDRDPWPNSTRSANWTCVGICAHDSALQGGQIIKLPSFTQSYGASAKIEPVIKTDAIDRALAATKKNVTV